MQEEDVDNVEEDSTIFHLVGIEDERKSLLRMEGTINGETFKTIIKSGSPVTIFGEDELKRILKVEEITMKPMNETKNYFDYNRSLLKLCAKVGVSGQKVPNAIILVAKRTCKSILGRD